MGDVIVIQYTTLDGVVSDPDGRAGTGYGGWMFRYGPEAVEGDQFRLGPLMERGVQLYGRRTWEVFTRLWPNRDTDFARLMNAATKRVATRTGIDPSAWSNSAPVDGDPLAWVKGEREHRDVVVIGSRELVQSLAAADLIDEYRLITFPLVAGDGDRLFGPGAPAGFRFTTVEPLGAAVLTILRRDRDGRPGPPAPAPAE